MAVCLEALLRRASVHSVLKRFEKVLEFDLVAAHKQERRAAKHLTNCPVGNGARKARATFRTTR
eukprot:1062190-Pleurochrysis_carterae.AAC.1